ncbi:MAG: DUF485 domain-containing protein [Campylobacterales bacterium]|nr:DUF485 domain-containing protein [Campylobacterales bacterium]
MTQEMVEKIKNNPDYQEMVEKRQSFAWKLTIAMLVVYFAFILTIAFSPSMLGIPLSEGGVTTVGIPVGIAVIIFAFVLTGIYTKRANSEFDDLANRVKNSIKEIQ